MKLSPVDHRPAPKAWVSAFFQDGASMASVGRKYGVPAKIVEYRIWIGTWSPRERKRKRFAECRANIRKSLGL